MMSLHTIDTDATTVSTETMVEMAFRRGEPEWLIKQRVEAWRAYGRIPMPSRTEEEWRRTDISALNLQSVVSDLASTNQWDGSKEVAGRRYPQTAGRGSKAGGRLVRYGSSGAYCQLPDDLLSKGVLLADLEDAVKQRPELVKSHLMALVPPERSKLAALHGAFWTGGTFVYVPKNVSAEIPLHALTWSDLPGPAAMPHTLVIVEAGANLILVDELASPEADGPVMANHVAELVLGDGARLHYVLLQRWGRSVFSFGLQRALLGQDAHLTSLTVTLGSRFSKSWVETILQSPGATTQMLGIGFGAGDQRFHHHTLQDHLAPKTSSDLLFKTALAGHARSEYSGLIRVHREAQKTDAYQANRNLLLSKQTRAHSMPRLEIEANDVRCTHGATAGSIDPEQLFYLMSRGLQRGSAERMLVEAFFEPVLERIPLDSVRGMVHHAIRAKLSAVGAQ